MVRYGYVTPDDVPILMEQHIGKGKIVDHLWRYLVTFIYVIVLLHCLMSQSISCGSRYLLTLEESELMYKLNEVNIGTGGRWACPSMNRKLLRI